MRRQLCGTLGCVGGDAALTLCGRVLGGLSLSFPNIRCQQYAMDTAYVGRLLKCEGREFLDTPVDAESTRAQRQGAAIMDQIEKRLEAISACAQDKLHRDLERIMTTQYAPKDFNRLFCRWMYETSETYLWETEGRRDIRANGRTRGFCPTDGEEFEELAAAYAPALPKHEVLRA